MDSMVDIDILNNLLRAGYWLTMDFVEDRYVIDVQTFDTSLDMTIHVADTDGATLHEAIHGLDATIKVHVAAREAMHKPTEDVPVESERDRNGRLLYGVAVDLNKDALDHTYVGIRWHHQNERSHIFWKDLAERFLAEVQPQPPRHDTESARIDELQAWLTDRSEKMRNLYVFASERQGNKDWVSGAKVAFDETYNYVTRQKNSFAAEQGCEA